MRVRKFDLIYSNTNNGKKKTVTETTISKGGDDKPETVSLRGGSQKDKLRRGALTSKGQIEEGIRVPSGHRRGVFIFTKLSSAKSLLKLKLPQRGSEFFIRDAFEFKICAAPRLLLFKIVQERIGHFS
ncbi:hypothetical protein CDAR_216501 [Caerostris darwini]|uniref:Uncharacterized protein n=1 Tax=Caerostris darwini TaxID=1538125 RepID=A0AAV4W8J9_9ARAC|nr:hypothetical protein CDAR_216501 [Caerostris darwini]